MIFSLKILIMLRLVINSCKNIDKVARLKLLLNKFQYELINKISTGNDRNVLPFSIFDTNPLLTFSFSEISLIVLQSSYLLIHFIYI